MYTIKEAAIRAGDGLLVAVGGPGAVAGAVSGSTLWLPDGIGASADVFEDALARRAWLVRRA